MVSMSTGTKAFVVKIEYAPGICGILKSGLVKSALVSNSRVTRRVEIPSLDILGAGPDAWIEVSANQFCVRPRLRDY